RKSALNARAREGALIVIDNFNYDKPSTKALVSLIDALGVAGKKLLVLTDGMKHNVFLSGRNLQRVHVMPYSDVSTYHILWSDVVLIESNALGYALETVEEKREPGGTKREAAKARSARAAKAEAKAEAKAAKKSARKAATHKAEAKSAKPKAKAAKKKPAKKSAGKKKGK
ncbi:MAG: 50S ribosomal protein L4, partial [Gemmatimonas sp. 13_1_20CM_3_60_15]